MARRNILLCFDAFGTLFKPQRPIPEQYAAVAQQCGVEGFTVEQLQASFKAAFSAESRAHPNYGKTSGMGAERWWTNVIHRTFLPLVGGSGKQLPPDLAPRLLHRFSSREGYSLVPGVSSLLPSLKHAAESNNGSHRVTVGVITNSDGRVPDILSSLGLRVSPLRFQEGIQATAQSTGDSQYDIDFHCMSYDVGFAKPDREIFDAAEAMANALVAAQHDASSTQTRTEGQPWTKVYVGDEFEKDVKGAWEAGWNAVFTGSEADISQIKPVDLEQLGSTALDDQFPTVDPPRMARADSIQLFLEWLIKQQTMA